jgi:hypothetical protein
MIIYRSLLQSSGSSDTVFYDYEDNIFFPYVIQLDTEPNGIHVRYWFRNYWGILGFFFSMS